MEAPNIDIEETSSFKKVSKFIISRLIRIIISFTIVTVGFLVTDTPILATATATLAWVLTSMFVSVASCLLTTGEK